MKKLILITNNFPFGSGEEFIETEIKYLSSKFDAISVLTFSSDTKERRFVPNNVSVFSIKIGKSIWDFFYMPLLALKIDFYKEIFVIRKDFKTSITLNKIKKIISYMLYGFKLKKIINKYHLNNSNDIYLYSYWMLIPAYTISNINKTNVFKFCRAHRGDLYHDRNELNYLPFRRYILNHLDRVFTVSEDGREYLMNNFNIIDKQNIIVSRLGISNLFCPKKYKPSVTFNIVSCSYITSIKRLDQIIDVLSSITSRKINWIHIGDGPLLDDIQSYANEKLFKHNITYKFKGRLSNNAVYNYYRNTQIDLFINLSDSEGIPVSIMEAISFGIPVLAKDVGGNREIVSNNNGFLVSNDASLQDISETFIGFLESKPEDIYKLRLNSRKLFEEKFNAEKNYRKFIEDMEQI